MFAGIITWLFGDGNRSYEHLSLKALEEMYHRTKGPPEQVSGPSPKGNYTYRSYPLSERKIRKNQEAVLAELRRRDAAGWETTSRPTLPLPSAQSQELDGLIKRGREAEARQWQQQFGG